MEITSVNNDLVKETVKLQQRKYRNQTGKFLLEGFKAIKEAFDCGIVIEKVFVEKNKKDEYVFASQILIETNEAVLKKLATTDSAPESVAVGIQKKYDKKILKNTKKVLLLEDIKDLGNLGTIIRSSVAFGADAIVLYGESVDIYNPKSVRASVGNLWKLPIVQIKSIEDLKEIFVDFQRVATLPRTNNLLKTYNPKTPDLIEFSTDSVKIEMAQTVESLNLATSVAIVLYEMFVE